MAANFDLTLIPIYRIKGQEWPQPPGLAVAMPPKNAARERERDSLIIFLTLTGNIPYSSIEYNQIVNQLAQRFYEASSSLTAAIRSTAEVLNQFIVERNMRTTGKGRYTIGRMVLGVVRDNKFIFVQCGPTHVFHLSAGATRQVHDLQISGRGLGFSQTTPLYLSQVNLQVGDKLMLCAHLPSNWGITLLEEHGRISSEALIRKLLKVTDEDINSVLVHVQAGNGMMKIIRGGKQEPELYSSVSRNKPVDVNAQPQKASPSQVERLPRPLNQPITKDIREQTDSLDHQATISEFRMIPEVDHHSALSQPPQQKSKAGYTGSAPPRFRKLFQWLAWIIQTGRIIFLKISRGLIALSPRLLPGSLENEARPSILFMVIASIFLPALVITIANVVYIQSGRATQYIENYNLAIQTAVGAIGQSNPAVVRHAWESTLYYLERAESYQVTQDSQALRHEAQAALDGLDGIIRLDFGSTSYGRLDRAIQVKRMVASETDLYLLDSTQGNILRAYLTSQGYEMDTTFQCAPGLFDGKQVGALIDLSLLPKVNEHDATVLAMDANGTLLYCAPGVQPIASSLITPELGWRSLSGFTLDSNNKDLYLLDPGGNAVWVYSGSMGVFSDMSILFFGEQVPKNMNTAIDIAVNGSDLFLLFTDGHVTICTLSQLDVVTTRCSDPVTINDIRPGHEPGATITDAIFSQMSFTTPPDPSLYILEPLTKAVYRFSPRADSLNLQGQFRATVEQVNSIFTSPVSAMAIGPNRNLFLCLLGNQIYYATDIP